jgi:hypothetical protein
MEPATVISYSHPGGTGQKNPAYPLLTVAVDSSPHALIVGVDGPMRHCRAPVELPPVVPYPETIIVRSPVFVKAVPKEREPVTSVEVGAA